jgi:hypothetical protein
MDQAALVDELVPGPLKDEMLGKFNPDQETYEEYLQRINLERPFNMAEGGQLVAPSVDGSRPGYQGDKTLKRKDSNPYFSDKKFLKYAKENFNFTPGMKLSGDVRASMVSQYLKQLALKDKIVGVEGLITALGENNPYSASQISSAFANADKKITKNMDRREKSKIKRAKNIKDIIVSVTGDPQTLGEVFEPYSKYIKYIPSKGKITTKGTYQAPTRVFKLTQSQLNKLNKNLIEYNNKFGFQEGTIDNIYNLFDDKKFMNEVRKYAGGEVDIDSYLFKKVFEPGKGGKNAYAYMQLGRVLKGEIQLDGINVDKKLGNKIVRSIAHDSATNIEGEMGKAAQRYAKFQMAKHFDDPKATYASLTNSISKAFKDAGVPVDSKGRLKINTDEIFPARTGQLTFGKGSGVYNNFVQFIDSKINQKTKRSFDGRMSGRLTELDKQYKLAKKTGDYSKVENILKAHDEDITDTFKTNPEMKRKVNLTRFRWDAKNKKFLSPEQVFESQYKGSYKTIPSKIRAGMEKFYAKTGISIDPGTARTLEAAQKEITTLDQKGIHKFLKQAGFNINKCLSSGGRVKLQGGGGVNTCIKGVIEAEQKKAMKGNKASLKKFGKFGKLARTGGWILGPLDIPLELAFALPHMLAGDKEAAKRATTFGLFGWGKDKLDEVKADSPEAYKYAKHMKDNENYIDAYFSALDASENLDRLKDLPEHAQKEKKLIYNNQFDKAQEKMASIQAGYVGYGDEEGKDVWEEAKGKSATQDYFIKDVKEKADKGLDMKQYGGHGMNIALGLPWNFGMKSGDVAPFKGGQPITNLKQYIAQRGQPYWKQLEHATYEAGIPTLFDNYFATADVREPEDAYSDLPIKYAGELGKLEKEEMLRGLKEQGEFMTRGFKDSLEAQGIDWDEAMNVGKKDWKFDIFGKRRLRAFGGRASHMGGGIASIRRPHAIPPKSGPTPQGLPSMYNRVKRI